ncbi:acetyl-CoA acetyltransferase [Enterococcus sp. LJL128]
MNDVYILNGVQTDFERNWSKEGKTELALLKEVVEDLLTKTGISREELKELNDKNRVACFVGNFAAERYVNQGHLGSLLTEVDEVFYGIPSARYEAACASGSVAVDAAVSKIRSDDYDVAIVIGWEMMKTVDSATGGDILGLASLYEEEANGVAYPFPNLFGRLASKILELEEGREDLILSSLATISQKNYANAKRNQLAQTRKWFMSKDHALGRGSVYNPIIGDGVLAVSDCSQVTDGAAAVILCNEAYLSGRDQANVSKIKGWGHRVAPLTLKKKLAGSSQGKPILPWTKLAVSEAYKRAGLNVADIDVFETHDCFTSSEYVAVSSFGICGEGEEYKVIEAGLTSFAGEKPINPSGGLIGAGHPVGASGVRMLLDLHKQVTNQAGTYQIKDAKNGAMLNLGGSATTNFAFIVGRP